MYKHAITLECDFGLVRHYWGEMYTCVARNLHTRHYYDYVVNATGDHLTGKTDRDVEAVYFLGQRTRFLPYNISTPFPGLRALRVEDSGLMFLNHTLAYEGPLEYLHFERNQIRDVPVWAFKGLGSVRWLSFRNNHIKYLESSLLMEMPKLRRFSASNNAIEVVPSGMFSFNPELEEIYYYNNKIRMVGSRLVESLPKLKVAAFLGNPCTDLSVYDGNDIRNKMRTEFTTRCGVNCQRAEGAAQRNLNQLKDMQEKQQECVDKKKDAQRQNEYQNRHPKQPKNSSESDEN